MKINVFGASGAGTTFLGKSLSQGLEIKFLDADEYYWKKTVPPYLEKIPKEDRISNLKKDFYAEASVIITGSLMSWGKDWEEVFDLAFFLYLPQAIRMTRLQAREKERYGERLESDPIIRQNSAEFLAWAREYDNPDFGGKNITRHQNWMKKVKYPVIKLKNSGSMKSLVNRAIKEVELFSN